MNTDELKIAETLRTFANAYCRKDLQGILATFTRTLREIVVIGSGSTEPFTDFQSLESHLRCEFAEWDDISIDPSWISLTIRDDVAWVATMSQTKSPLIGRRKSLRGRFTAVLVKEDENWRIAQLHFSFACNKRLHLLEQAIFPQGERVGSTNDWEAQLVTARKHYSTPAS